jgi:hypothetical protein
MRAIRVSTAPLLAALAIAGVVVAAAVTGSRPLADDLAIGVAVTTYAFVAVVIELARPGHPVGRLMLAGATAWGIGEGLLALGLAGVVAAPDRAAYVVLGVVGSAARGCGWLLLILALPLVFPRRPGSGPRAGRAGRRVCLRVHGCHAARPGPVGVPAGDRRKPARPA